MALSLPVGWMRGCRCSCGARVAPCLLMAAVGPVLTAPLSREPYAYADPRRCESSSARIITTQTPAAVGAVPFSDTTPPHCSMKTLWSGLSTPHALPLAATLPTRHAAAAQSSAFPKTRRLWHALWAMRRSCGRARVRRWVAAPPPTARPAREDQSTTAVAEIRPTEAAAAAARAGECRACQTRAGHMAWAEEIQTPARSSAFRWRTGLWVI